MYVYWVCGDDFASVICVDVICIGERVWGCVIVYVMCVICLNCLIKLLGKLVREEMGRCRDAGASGECLEIMGVLVWVLLHISIVAK